MTAAPWAMAAAIAFTTLLRPAHAAGGDEFRLTSSTFRDGGQLPRRASNDISGNARCVGQNVSPQLSWQHAPEGTKSFAIVIVNPEGRAGLGSTHWVAYGIAPSVSSLAEGEASKISDKYVGGTNTLRVGHYSGPCAPAGYPQHYTFVIIATDLSPTDLPPGLTLLELQDKLSGHVRGATGIVGLFKHPQ
jgi:Raf kinase inhibitor-like YbhB/YbcL family protein